MVLDDLSEEVRKEVQGLIAVRKGMGRLIGGLFIVAVLFSLTIYWLQEIRIRALEMKIQEADSQIAALKVQLNDVGVKAYINKAFGYSLIVPGDWIVMRENEKTAEDKETNTTIQSPDFKKSISGNGVVSINSGASLNIWIQKPSRIKSITEMVGYFKLPRSDHSQEQEVIAVLGGKEALAHVLGDYAGGALEDIHALYNDAWFTLSFSYDKKDPKMEEVFQTIKESFRFLP